MGYRYLAAFCETLKEFCKKTSNTGFQYLMDHNKTRFERCLWCVLQVILFGCTLLMVFHTWQDIFVNPLVISLETTAYPIQEVPFPAISICNINKISKKRAVEFAELLSKKVNLPFNDTIDNIKILGKLYSYGVDDVEDLLKFQSYLDKYRAPNDNSLYSVMKNLSTPCEELLYKCTWKGQIHNCSEIFHLRRTYEGFCCTFNYLRPSPKDTSIKPRQEPQTVNEAGLQEGLIVVIRNEPDDYFYPTISTVGVNVHIFGSNDYPDATSGSLLEELIPVGTETFLRLESSTIHSVAEVRDYPVSTRKCIFGDELSTVLGQYSFSNCLVQCRVESMLALCQCVPFIIPSDLKVSECILPDIVCLEKYQDKWRSLYPRDFKTDELEHEKQNSLLCPNCYSTCSDTSYRVFTNFAPLNLQESNKRKYKNFSVVRIYFGYEHSKLYKRDVVYYWFEILSNFGGLLGIFLGFSFVSIIEFVYFITIRFIFTLKKFKA